MEPTTNPITLYLTQFVVMFLLGWAAGHSLRIWTTVTVAVLGLLFIPVIVTLLFLGDSSGWNIIADLFRWLGNQLADGFRTIPILLGGTLLGILYGLGIRL